MCSSSVVSAGIFRIFGQEVAELPLVATSSDYQGQGYFQSLFSCIERLLGFLNVKTLALPAAGEADAIWTDRFGFEKINPDQLSEYRKNFQMTVLLCYRSRSQNVEFLIDHLRKAESICYEYNFFLLQCRSQFCSAFHLMYREGSVFR